MGRQDVEAERQLAEESRRRSRQRRELAQERRRARGIRGILILGAVALGAVAIVLETAGQEPGQRIRAAASPAPTRTPVVDDSPNPRAAHPSPGAIKTAWRYASSRAGLVSAAVVDSDGALTGLRARRRFVSASVVKAVMLVAYLRELARQGASLDSSTEEVLRAMITVSDNDAADTIYYRLGDDPMEQVAREAGAGTLDVRGYWSETYLSARDGARFISRAEQLLPRRFRRFGMGLLADVVAYQRWGIPAAAEPDWKPGFKGGWRGTDRGQLVHQIAVLRRGRTRISLAILTDAMPSHEYGVETLEGITLRLLGTKPTPLTQLRRFAPDLPVPGASPG